MPDPGSIGSQVPRGDDEVQKQIKELQSQVQQALAAAANASAVAAIALKLVSPAVGSASLTSYTVTTSYQTFATFNFTTPVGATRALITASGAVTFSSNAGGGTALDNAFTRIVINGTAGQESSFLFNVGDTDPSVSATGALSLSGLVANQTIAVGVQGRFSTGPAIGFPNLSTSVTGSALFLS